jgi:hypothetical protein
MTAGELREKGQSVRCAWCPAQEVPPEGRQVPLGWARINELPSEYDPGILLCHDCLAEAAASR